MFTGPRCKLAFPAAAVVVLCLGHARTTHAAVSFRTVALNGDAAPGADPGVTFKSFRKGVSVNGLGQTVFHAVVQGPGVDSSNANGLWSEGSGLLSLVARQGDHAPGTEPGVVFDLLSTATLNDAGHVAFRGILSGPGIDTGADSSTGLWWNGTGALTQVVRAGDFAPDTGPGVVFTGHGTFAFNNSDSFAFGAAINGPGVDSTNNVGIWSGPSDDLRLVVRRGDPVPGFEAGTSFSTVQIAPGMGQAGQVGWTADLVGPGIDSTNNESLWSGLPGSVSMVARTGDQAPDIEAGKLFTSLNLPKVNALGELAFLAGVTSTIGIDAGIWSQGGGTLHLVARYRDPAPGTDTVFSGLEQYVLNNAGKVAFIGALPKEPLSDFAVVGIWRETEGSSELVVKTQDQAPGTEPGTTFFSLGDNITRGFLFNDAGQIAFEAWLTGPGLDFLNRHGVWATGPDGNPQLVARTGDWFDVNADPLVEDLRQILDIDLLNYNWVGFEGPDNGMPSAINNAGELALWMSFTDGTQGVFVAQAPEPAAGIILLTGLILLNRRAG